MRTRHRLSPLVSRVDVADHAHARVVREHPFEAFGTIGRPVRHHLRTGMDRFPDADTASVVNRPMLRQTPCSAGR